MDGLLKTWSLLNMLATTLILLHLLSPYLLVLAQSTTTLTVSVPLSAPTSAVTLDPALLSFSLEQDRWPEWVATGANSDAPNTFFLNALDNLKQRTGASPWIRIGADSEDHTNFNKRVDVRTIFRS